MILGAKRILFVAGAVAWIGLSGWGMKYLADYSFAHDAAAEPSPVWPADTAIERDPESYTLVVALHPQCPCSRASVEEIDRILAYGRGRVRVVALFFGGNHTETELSASGLWQRAQRLKHTVALVDPDGSELQRFHFRTSGETRLYAADGTLRFSGGVTLSRGHAGANPGRSAIEALLSGAMAAPLTVTPAFGCGLFAHQEAGRGQT